MTRLDPVREAEAVRSLRESLEAMGAGGDDALLIDSIEGETGLLEAIDALLERMAADKALIEGTAVVIDHLSGRAARFERRHDASRALIEQAMMIAELDNVERPTATLSLTRRAPKVEITTEADIPAEFWKAAAPKLDKKALADALKRGRDVPGACLSNAAPSLTVRVA